jgi:serum/glucocorticoid-regulated kinase 2
VKPKVGSFCGTNYYLAPEVITNEEPTYAIDWWGLGILAFRLLCGYFPFQSDNIGLMYKYICEREVIFPPTLDEDAKDLIRGLLKKESSERLGMPKNPIGWHPYFKSLSFKGVAKMQYNPQFKPSVSAPDSIQNFRNFRCGNVAVHTENREGRDGVWAVRCFSYSAPSSDVPSAVSYEDLTQMK